MTLDSEWPISPSHQPLAVLLALDRSWQRVGVAPTAQGGGLPPSPTPPMATHAPVPVIRSIGNVAPTKPLLHPCWPIPPTLPPSR